MKGKRYDELKDDDEDFVWTTSLIRERDLLMGVGKRDVDSESSSADQSAFD